MSRAERIETALRAALQPDHLELIDESWKHHGHPGATSGGGHFRLVLVAEAFRGLSRIERHRRVHAALEGLFGETIHALSMRTLTPEEWDSTT